MVDQVQGLHTDEDADGLCSSDDDCERNQYCEHNQCHDSDECRGRQVCDFEHVHVCGPDHNDTLA